MASLSSVKAANNTIGQRHDSMTALFTGATHGIGFTTLQAFVKYIPMPTVIVAGRNRRAFEPEIAKFKQLNANVDITFIEGDLSLIKNIDSVAQQITTQLGSRSVDFLCMSQGYAPLEGRTFTTEGLDKAITVFYYGRLRLLHKLIASKTLKPNANVLMILAGGKEGKIFEDDLGLDRNYSILNMRAQLASLTTLSFDVLSKQNPEMSLVHVYPGTVDTGLLARRMQNWAFWLIALVGERLLMMFNGATSAGDSGERMLDLALGGKYGKGSWSMEESEPSRSEWLEKYRGDGKMAEKAWEFNEATWQKALKA